MQLVPYYKTTIHSKLTPKEICQKLTLIVDYKDLDEVYVRDFLSYGITDTLIFSEYDKVFIGEFNEEYIEIRTSSNVGSQGRFNLNYLFGKISPNQNGGSTINVKVHPPEFYSSFLLVVLVLILIGIITLVVILPKSVPRPLYWLPSILTTVFYCAMLIRYNMGLYVYKERLFPHIKSNSIQDILNRRKINKERRAARRR